MEATVEIIKTPQMVSEADAANFIGVTKKTLQTWRCRKRGPAYIRVARKCIRYKIEDLIAYMEARRVELD